MTPEPTGPAGQLHDDDAWDWGGESASGQAFDPAAAEYLAAGWSDGGGSAVHEMAPQPQESPEGEPDWFEQPLSTGAEMGLPPTWERAARALEGLAHQLRAGSLSLDARAALDSDEAVLASVLAALFARRTR